MFQMLGTPFLCLKKNIASGKSYWGYGRRMPHIQFSALQVGTETEAQWQHANKSDESK
jgi:hypothetical protein